MSIDSKHMIDKKGKQATPCLISIKFNMTYVGCLQVCIPENLWVLQNHALNITGFMGIIGLSEGLPQTHATL